MFDRTSPVNTPLAAWRRLVRPGDRVGLKVNTLGGRGISTSLELVAAICERLQQAGIKPGDIIVWDRDSDEMEHAGFKLSDRREPRAMLRHRSRRITKTICLRTAA